jgi:hypothetical protein
MNNNITHIAMSSKTQLLDPMGTLCRLIFLNFEPKSTKVVITNHAIQIQSPFYGQWIFRRLSGDGINNIYVLFQIFRRVIEWYIIPLYNLKHKIKTDIQEDSDQSIDNTKDNTNKEEQKQLFLQVSEAEVDIFWSCMQKLCSYLCNALSQLQYTYVEDNTIVVIALQFYINMIRESVEGRYSVEKLPSCITNNESDSLFDFDKIKGLWDCSKVHEICDLFDKCFATATSEDSYKHKKVESYLTAIDKLLEISDNSFRDLIQSSNRGQ